MYALFGEKKWLERFLVPLKYRVYKYDGEVGANLMLNTRKTI